MKGQTSMLSNKRGCPRRTNVGLDRVSIVPLDWSMDDINKHGKQHHTGQRNGMHRANRHHGDVSHEWLHLNRP